MSRDQLTRGALVYLVLFFTLLLLQSTVCSAMLQEQGPVRTHANIEQTDFDSVVRGNEYAFASILCDAQMEQGVTVLHESILKVGHRQPFVILVARSVPQDVVDRVRDMPLAHVLRATGDHVRFCGTGAVSSVEGADDCSHLKLLLFGIQQAKKIIFLEYDTVVLKSLAELADQPPFSAIREPHADVHDPSVMVIQPDQAVARLMRQEYCSRAESGSYARDHIIIREVVPDAAWNCLNDTFNVPHDQMDTVWYRKVVPEPHVIHFRGQTKPWNWWTLRLGEEFSTAAFTYWCRAAELTRFSCGMRPETDEVLISSLPTGSSESNKLTVLMSTYHRSTWRSLAKHYLSMKVVGRLVLIWHDPDSDPPPERELGANAIVYHARTNSLNNRFVLPRGGTECVYVCDDDMRVSEASLTRGFRVWKTQTRRLIGFFPRKWMTEEPFYSTRIHDGYNIVLTKGLYTHRTFLYQYVNLLPKHIKNIVDKQQNCEDILFNMMVSGYTGVAPMHLMVEERIYDLGHGGGISSRGMHYSTRYQCVQDLMAAMAIHEAPMTPGSLSVRPLKNRERK